MAYNKKDLIKSALTAIEKHKLFFIDDVVAFMPCSKTTFYAKQLNKSDTIKEALEKNKVEVKVSMRSKWYKSDQASLQISLMKLIGTEEEAARLNGSKQQHEHSGTINTVVVKPAEGCEPIEDE